MKAPQVGSSFNLRRRHSSETAKAWFAAAFHLGAMLDREPNNQALQARWDRAVAELAKEDPALAERVAAKRKQ